LTVALAVGAGASFPPRSSDVTQRVTGDRLDSIQYVRAIAALAVVTWHSIYHVKTGYHFLFRGQAGVDLFFIVSGFIMTYIGSRAISPGRFLLSRLAKVVPLYWIATVLTATACGATLPDVLMSLVFWPYDVFPVLSQGWTLQYELFFYVVFATCLIWRRHTLAALTIALISFYLLGLVLQPTSSFARVYSSPLLFEFLAGAWLAFAWQRRWILQGRWALLLVGVGLLAVLIQGPAGRERLLLWGSPALLIVAGLLGVEEGGRLPKLPVLRAIGDSSYAIYLFHNLILSWVSPLLMELRSPLATTLAVVVSTVGGFLIHRVIGKLTAAWSKTELAPILLQGWPKGRSMRPITSSQTSRSSAPVMACTGKRPMPISTPRREKTAQQSPGWCSPGQRRPGFLVASSPGRPLRHHSNTSFETGDAKPAPQLGAVAASAFPLGPGPDEERFQDAGAAAEHIAVAAA
jgi:exopolysaccharide production protein ExoZ